ncbi:18929_t:CDS:2, partial [Racocetra persica]
GDENKAMEDLASGNILRKGYWQGKLTLDYDPGGRMAECFARGVSFYDNKDKTEFPNPKLG